MIRKSVFRCSAVLFFVASATNGWAATTYDPTASFEQGFLSKSNPNGVWSYGSSSGSTSPVTLFTQAVQTGFVGPNLQYWSSSPNPGSSGAFIGYNNGPALINGINLLANELMLVPLSGQNSNVVFTAPAAGTYSMTGSFRGDQDGIGVVVGVVANGSLLLSTGISAVGQILPFSYTVTLSAGSTVVFSSGPGAETNGRVFQ
jgi:hypothetical protein